MPRRSGPATVARRLGARVRSLRVEAKLTQERLAWECDLDKGYLSQVEAGKRLPSIPVLLALASRLKVEGADLLMLDVGRPRFQLLDAVRRRDRTAVHEALRKLGLA
jgi:transcriptional regulator with XRE-family HTH domain